MSSGECSNYEKRPFLINKAACKWLGIGEDGFDLRFTLDSLYAHRSVDDLRIQAKAVKAGFKMVVVWARIKEFCYISSMRVV
ncbi:hypothetical protein COB72_02860 [bacterium]|nr:MAG: hypothetical protein COB72_02860 [bacterium]